jgi:hypothetical protein
MNEENIERAWEAIGKGIITDGINIILPTHTSKF